jgi:hypothetical protein
MRGTRLIRIPLQAWPRWKVQLAVGAIFRNEARYLPEWIEFHQQQGVERFYLYENNSTDEWEQALEPYRKVVEVRSWSDHPGQCSAYTDCLQRHRWDTRWLALIDLDEFLFSPTGQSLPEVLRQFRWVASVVVNWRCYGPSGHEDPPNAPVVESYTRRAADDHPQNRHIKSIVFPAATVLPVWNPHYFAYHGLSVDERGDRTPPGVFRDPPTADLLRINHYWTRSNAEWRDKLMRPRADVPEPLRSEVEACSDIAPMDAVFDPILARRGDSRAMP